MKTLTLIAALFLYSLPTERTVGHNIDFMVDKNHNLIPMLSMNLTVDQEEGGIAEGHLRCDLIARQYDGGFRTVLRCGDKKFLVTGINFTESGR